MRHAIRHLILVLAAAALAPSNAQEPASSGSSDVPGADVYGIPGDGGLDVGDMAMTGNPLQRLGENWPEDLVIAPIPGRSPQLGWMLTLAGGYFLGAQDEQSGSPPSVIGGFGMYAENGSYAYGAGGKFHLFDDRLRIRAGAGYADVRYRYYGRGNDAGDLGISVDILQEMPLYFASASYRIWNRLFIGLGYLGGDVESRLRVELPDVPFFDPSLQVDIGAWAIPIEYDARDHEQFPRDGWLIEGKSFLYRKSAGSSFDAETFKLAVNHYRPVREYDVLALRAFLRTTSGDAPFFLLSTFGGSTDLRGYPSGRYRDRMMYALQGEYRWQVNDKWILTGFAGVGEVAADFSEFGRNFLPAVGVGARYVLSQKHKVSLSADIAAGKDGTEFYFGVGEAF